ncbi:hypothetical protein PHMEG_00019040 [Phytophthora megakarya]|uniref:PiggyBac transposable element-derived protein domain-containing protein n=1 Tax=Phytophthora megakarya TaxID=4795 RepID=A0A225VTD5_9STRA|nr:hypothetical protein PHMEG_00019040 [Phytophthora megakarya]
MANDYPDIFGDEDGPTVAALGAASTPMETFFLFGTLFLHSNSDPTGVSQPLLAFGFGTKSSKRYITVSPSLLQSIAGTSNDYFMENLDARVEGQLANQRALKETKPKFQVKSPDFVKQNLLKMQDISGREIAVFLGLLMARTIAPNKKKSDNHWKTTDEGAIPRECFDALMTRDRFYYISRNHQAMQTLEQPRTELRSSDRSLMRFIKHF